jgi:N-methylhydantoinase B
MSAAQTDTAVDAFTAEVIRNAVVAITREMKTNLMRTAYSSIIYEAEDVNIRGPHPSKYRDLIERGV